MKKLLFIIGITISNLSFGQIILEHAYTTASYNEDYNNFAFHTDSGLHYYTTNEAEGKVLIYDTSHNLYKTVTLNLETGFNLETVNLLTDKLFNANSNIEFIVVSRNNDVTPSIKKMTLYDEDGANLFEFGNRWNATCVKNSDSNYKLITSTLKSDPDYYEVYDLPGVLSVAQQETLIKSQLFSFPNPASNRITIVNSLKSGQIELLEVFDISGKKILEKNVSGNSKEINLDVTNFKSGVYIYKLNGKTNRFIKD